MALKELKYNLWCLRVFVAQPSQLYFDRAPRLLYFDKHLTRKYQILQQFYSGIFIAIYGAA